MANVIPAISAATPDGRLVDAEIIASHHDCGWTQQVMDRMVASEIAGIPR